jgi:hypothetical protein
MLEALDLRHVRMPVDDRVAVLEPRGKPSLPPGPRPRVVDHPDPDALHLHDPLLRQQLLERRLVHVPADTFDRRPDATQFLENLRRDEVASVQQQVRPTDQP